MTGGVEILSPLGVVKEFKRSKSGLTGIAILSGLILMTVYAIAAFPLSSFTQWNNPSFWIDLPKSAAPVWVNFLGPKMPEHIILTSQDAATSITIENGVRVVTYSYSIDYIYDSYPNDLMMIYAASYGSTQPALEIDVLRPDGNEFEIYFAPLPSAMQGKNEFAGRIFSTDKLIQDNLRGYGNIFDNAADTSRPQVMIFSDTHENKVLKGTYVIRQVFYLFDESDSIVNSGLILGGKVYGILGTDDLRHDLAIGILWGAPVALFIGLTVSVAAVPHRPDLRRRGRIQRKPDR